MKTKEKCAIVFRLSHQLTKWRPLMYAKHEHQFILFTLTSPSLSFPPSFTMFLFMSVASVKISSRTSEKPWLVGTIRASRIDGMWVWTWFLTHNSAFGSMAAEKWSISQCEYQLQKKKKTYSISMVPISTNQNDYFIDPNRWSLKINALCTALLNELEKRTWKHNYFKVHPSCHIPGRNKAPSLTNI